METIKQQALRMACDTFLADYEGEPTLAALSQLVAGATVWEPFEDYDASTVQEFIVNQYRTNVRELGKRSK